MAAILSLNGPKNNPKIVTKTTTVRPKGGGGSHKPPPLNTPLPPQILSESNKMWKSVQVAEVFANIKVVYFFCHCSIEFRACEWPIFRSALKPPMFVTPLGGLPLCSRSSVSWNVSLQIFFTLRAHVLIQFPLNCQQLSTRAHVNIVSLLTYLLDGVPVLSLLT